MGHAFVEAAGAVKGALQEIECKHSPHDVLQHLCSDAVKAEIALVIIVLLLLLKCASTLSSANS